METPSSSSNSTDSRESLQLYPSSSGDQSDLFQGQQLQRHGTFDKGFFMPDQSSTSPGSPVIYDDFHIMLERDEAHISNSQDHGHGHFDGAFDVELGSYIHDDSIIESTSSDSQSRSQCTSCSVLDSQYDESSTVFACRCNEIIITQLSSLPVLLADTEYATFEAELVQFQKSVSLCASVLACTCPGRDYSTMLTISMLIGRIISVLKRGCAQTGRDNVESTRTLIMTDAITPSKSPKFSMGMYEFEGEDERTLKREVWWMQIRKAESLITAFGKMIAEVLSQQACPDKSQAVVGEKLMSLLDQEVQAVKRDWSMRHDHCSMQIP